jgi:hypothetical protein
MTLFSVKLNIKFVFRNFFFFKSYYQHLDLDKNGSTFIYKDVSGSAITLKAGSGSA